MDASARATQEFQRPLFAGKSLCYHDSITICYEMAEGYVVEFKAQRTEITEGRPHGISYAP